MISYNIRRGSQQACKMLSSDRLCFQKVDKPSKTSHELKFSTKQQSFSCLICALNLYFVQNLLKVSKTAKSCSKVTKHHWDRPADETASLVIKHFVPLIFLTITTIYLSLAEKNWPFSYAACTSDLYKATHLPVLM